MLVGLALFSLSLGATEVTPTARVYQSIDFSDDLNFQNLELAINRQLDFYSSQAMSGSIRFGTKNYSKQILKESLILLKDLAQSAKACLESGTQIDCMVEFNKGINEKFAIYRPISSKAGKQLKTKFTSYYSPDLSGSRVPTQRFKRPIYRKPEETNLQNFTRVEIDYKGALAGKGYEIFWVEDSFFDLYLLHVQGGGRINIHNADGTIDTKYLSYAGKNNRPFKMIYHYLVENGYLEASQASVSNQRQFLNQNPDKEEEVFNSCPSYIYFKESDTEPVGLDNIPLTEGRSLALDSRIYKTTGLINFVKTVRASHIDESGTVVKVPFARFFIGQDTGGAIRGNARCDLYFGYGPLAELVAYNMDDLGEQYFLVKNTAIKQD